MTNRLLAAPWSEPLLIVNDPQPASQLACNSVTGICPVTGTGGTSTYNGSAGHPNIFQGQVSANAVTFLSVPIDPPGATGSLILRVTDVRVNASGVPPAGGVPGQVSALVSVTGVSVTNPQRIVGFVENSLNTQVRTSDDAAVLAAGGFSFDQCGSADKNRFATLRFSEAFPNAFRTRTIAPFVDANTSPAPVPQNVPGTVYNSSESWFYNPTLAGANGNLGVAGLADYGTRVKAVFHNIPAGVSLWVATEAVAFSGGNPVLKTIGLRARLIASEAGAFSATAATTTLDRIPAAQLSVTGGTATAVWEVLAADPLTSENLDVPVWLSYSTSGAGTGTLNLSYAPVPPVFSLIDGAAASATLPLARFLDSSTAANLFAINACITVSPASLSNATEGQPYSVQLSASGGTPGYSWSVVSGALPAGFTLASNGQLGGTPLTTGAYAFTVRVVDAAGRRIDTAYSLTAQLQAGCTYSLSSTSVSVPSTAYLSGTINVTASASNCAWAGISNAVWLIITFHQVSVGSNMLLFNAAPNPGSARTGTLTIAGQTFTVHQAGVPVLLTVAPGGYFVTYDIGGPPPPLAPLVLSSSGSPLSFAIQGNESWLVVPVTGGTTPATVPIMINPAGLAPGIYNGSVSISAPGASNSPQVVPVTLVVRLSLQFYPIPPCRAADTRNFTGPPGPLGPPSLSAQAPRSFPVLSSACGIPASAVAYSLNVSAVPLTGYLGYVTVWGTGQPQPVASTLNSWDGRIVANAAIVPAGANGAISIFASDATDVFLDINGYFAPPGAGSLEFYPLAPCRVADTRSFTGPPGPLGPPAVAAHGTRSFPVLSSACAIPATAAAYSLNVTAAPSAGYLGYLTAWGTGQPQPIASTLNSWTGTITANAAIVPAGTGGAISIYASDATDVFIDINGYFAPPGAGGLQYHPLAPCRVADTRSFTGPPGPLGPPPMTAGSSRSFPVLSSACGIPAAAAVYALNVTAVPAAGYLDYLTAWAAGPPQPVASTLNSWTGTIVPNAALVPAGTGGAISIFVSDSADVFFDINGYFAP